MQDVPSLPDGPLPFGLLWQLGWLVRSVRSRHVQGRIRRVERRVHHVRCWYCAAEGGTVRVHCVRVGLAPGRDGKAVVYRLRQM